MLRTIFIAVFAVLVSSGVTYAEETKKIQDNSFLIEEAYNQEDGVIQHIQSFQYLKKSRTWLYTFTQEWPMPKQTHQFSYTLPFAHIREDTSETGIGDMLLNYRYQLIFKGGIALAPRISLIIPTGNYKKGLGPGAAGVQINVPLSLEISDNWVNHWNAGFTYTPNAREPKGRKADTFGYNFGTSLIYLMSENFNIMTEAVFNSAQSVSPEADGVKTRENTFFINPGIRYAINFKSGLQVVPGLSFPIGIDHSKGEYGMLFYLSFEHPLF